MDSMKADGEAQEAPSQEQVSQIVRALDKNLRSRKLYAANNPTLIKHQHELNTLLIGYLKESEGLELTVAPFELRVGDEIVYQNTNQQESFAFRIFNDGIRSILFKPGLSEAEISEFLSALAARQADKASGADAVTLLWEHEFQHIRYAVADLIVEEQDAEQKSLSEKMGEVLQPGEVTYQSGAGAGDDFEEELYQDLKITLNPVSVGEMFKDRCVLLPHELSQIQADLAECDRPERLALDFVDMLLAVLQEEQDPREFDKILEALGGALETSLVQGQFRIARLTMEQVHALPQRSTGTGKEADPQLAKRILKTLWPAARVDVLIQSLNQGKIGETEDVETLISLIDPAILPHLLKQIGNIIDVNRRRLVAKGIARLHRGDLGIFMPMLTSKDTEAVRLGLFILSAVKNEKAIDFLPMLIQHQNQQVRKETVAILRNLKSPKAFRILLSLLQDADEEIRIHSLKILSSSGDKDTATLLLEAIRRKDFFEKSMQERKSYFHAVAKLTGDDFIPYLKTLLAESNWFKRKKIDDQYQCSTFALGMIGTPSARKALQETAKSGNKMVRRLSEAALRMMEGGA